MNNSADVAVGAAIVLYGQWNPKSYISEHGRMKFLPHCTGCGGKYSLNILRFNPPCQHFTLIPAPTVTYPKGGRPSQAPSENVTVAL